MPMIRKKPFVDKKRKQRIEEEERIAQGAEQWRVFLEKTGVENPETMRLDILFLSNGPAPDVTSSQSSEDNQADCIEK